MTFRRPGGDCIARSIHRTLPQQVKSGQFRPKRRTRPTIGRIRAQIKDAAWRRRKQSRGQTARGAGGRNWTKSGQIRPTFCRSRAKRRARSSPMRPSPVQFKLESYQTKVVSNLGHTPESVNVSSGVGAMSPELRPLWRRKYVRKDDRQPSRERGPPALAPVWRATPGVVIGETGDAHHLASRATGPSGLREDRRRRGGGGRRVRLPCGRSPRAASPKVRCGNREAKTLMKTSTGHNRRAGVAAVWGRCGGVAARRCGSVVRCCAARRCVVQCVVRCVVRRGALE